MVFDLDFTLWDAGGTWCDHLAPPFALRDDQVMDRNQNIVRLYDDVPKILDALGKAGIRTTLASRTGEPDWARELLHLLDIAGRFEFPQIYPGSKTQHFSLLRERINVTFDECLFFDDERRNITECSALGVKCVHVRKGLQWGDLKTGLRLFDDRHSLHR